MKLERNGPLMTSRKHWRSEGEIQRAYLVFYKIEGEFVSVYRILNGARDYLTVLFSEEPSEN